LYNRERVLISISWLARLAWERGENDEKPNDFGVRIRRYRRVLQLAVFDAVPRQLAAFHGELQEGWEAGAKSGPPRRESKGRGNFTRRQAARHSRRAEEAEERAFREQWLPRGEVRELRAAVHGAERDRCGEGRSAIRQRRAGLDGPTTGCAKG